MNQIQLTWLAIAGIFAWIFYQVTKTEETSTTTVGLTDPGTSSEATTWWGGIIDTIQGEETTTLFGKIVDQAQEAFRS